MTPVPVVSTPLNTRTVREWRPSQVDPWRLWEHDPDFPNLTFERLSAQRPDLVRTVTVADPVFVVLPEVPDLTCRTCAGLGIIPNDGDWTESRSATAHLCPSCGGSGVSPVYAAIWQYPPSVGLERRQLVEWRARRVKPLPVLTIDDADDRDCNCLVIEDDGSLWTWTDANEVRVDPSEPWAADLQPGMCVLRLSDWEHLEQPYIRMANEKRDPLSKRFTLPLSVPDGVLSWIELTR